MTFAIVTCLRDILFNNFLKTNFNASFKERNLVNLETKRIDFKTDA